MIDKHFCHRYFVLGGLGERDTNRIANTVREQRADTHSTLDSALKTVARLGHSEVDGIGHTLLLHSLNQQAVGVYHNARIARLHRHHHLIKILATANLQKLHCRANHTLRRIAPLIKDALCKRTVIDTDAQGYAALAALCDECLQLAVRGAVVTRIDAHLIHITCCY